MRGCFGLNLLNILSQGYLELFVFCQLFIIRYIEIVYEIYQYCKCGFFWGEIVGLIYIVKYGYNELLGMGDLKDCLKFVINWLMMINVCY